MSFFALKREREGNFPSLGAAPICPALTGPQNLHCVDGSRNRNIVQFEVPYGI